MSKKKRKAKKRTRKSTTRRAVATRRTDEENESAARAKRDEWMKKLKAAVSKVEFYDKRVTYYARKRAKQQVERMFKGV